MPNPGGNYPGRQIFLGQQAEGLPAFMYFVSGRSPASQQRYATFVADENAVRIKPLNRGEKFDPFRHYQAVRIDDETGLLLVSNSQAPNDALFETYKFREDISSNYMERLLAVIGPEYDNKEKPTPRITGIISPRHGKAMNILGITTVRENARCLPFTSSDGIFTYVQTYNGNVDYSAYNHSFDQIRITATTPQQLAEELYKMSDYVDDKYGDLRVCTVAGVKYPGGWDIAIKNRFSMENGSLCQAL